MSDIQGYRELTEEEVKLVNYVKGQGDAMGALIQTLRDNPDCDQRWVSIAQTHFQEGCMAAVRSVTKPTGFA